MNLRQRIKVRHNDEFIVTTPGRIIFNSLVPFDEFQNKTFNKAAINNSILEAFKTRDNEALGVFIDALKNVGLHYGTMSGQSASVSDVSAPAKLDEIIDEAKAKVEELNKALRRGLATPENVKSRADEIWKDVTRNVQDILWESLGPTNPVRELIESGSAKATKGSITQIAGLKGQIVDTTGKSVDYPILANYKNGYTGFDYFLSSKSARKGLADRALKTADSGYLTRRLVDVAQDVIIREENCRSTEGYPVIVTDKGYSLDFVKRMEGRFLAKDVKSGNKVIAKAGEYLTIDLIEEIKNAEITEISVRSPLFCQTKNHRLPIERKAEA